MNLTSMILQLAILAFRAHPVGSVLAVGDGRAYALIQDAVDAAQPGDEIDVFGKAGGYSGEAVRVRTAGLKIVGKGGRTVIDGGGFEYSGIGRVPRAIFQFDPGADGSTLEGFDLRNAHNKSYNGAGVRINQASRITIRDCGIYRNDMGIMSNGIDGNPHAGENQLIDHCTIHHNGNLSDPGYNHNLYLGGTSVTIQFCAISNSLTGHNLKSRAHFTLVRYNVISASANRELDFVEAWDTHRANSNAVLIGNIIAKDPDSKGNRTVINFGEEHDRRDGTIYLINNTIKTPFMSAIVDLSSSTSSARFVNNVIENHSQAHPILVSVDRGATLDNVHGEYNVMSPSYDVSGTAIDAKTLYTDPRQGALPDRDRPALSYLPGQAFYVDGNGKRHTVLPKYRHSPTKGWIEMKSPSIGAGD